MNRFFRFHFILILVVLFASSAHPIDAVTGEGRNADRQSLPRKGVPTLLHVYLIVW
jgi:hypothetical protein